MISPNIGGVAGGELLATRFLSTLSTPCTKYPQARIETRIWNDNRKPSQRWFRLTPESIETAATYCVSQAMTCDVYVGVLQRIPGKGDSSALRTCGWIWCDIDGGDDGVTGAMELLKTAVHRLSLPYPNMLVISGGGLHAYWMLSTLALCRTKDEQDRIRKILRRLVRAIGGNLPSAHADIASAEPARVLRVPGTFNHKQEGNPRRVRLLRCVTETGDERPLVWWAANLPAEPLPPRRQARVSSVSVTGSLSLPPRTRDKIAGGAPLGSRHYTMRDVAISAVKEGYDELSVRALVEQTARASGVDVNSSHESRHVDGIVAWAVANVTPEPFQPQGGYTR